VFRFEKLAVWQKAIEFADAVYSATASFPNDERFGLTSQLRRAAVSVSSNIAEGSSRSSNADFARFVEIAYGSTMEVVSQLHIARQQQFLADDALNDLCTRADEVSRMLSGLRTSLRRRETSDQSPEADSKN
jgi:four helix bundle protein